VDGLGLGDSEPRRACQEQAGYDRIALQSGRVSFRSVCRPGIVAGSWRRRARNLAERTETLHHGARILRGVLTRLLPELFLPLQILIDFDEFMRSSEPSVAVAHADQHPLYPPGTVPAIGRAEHLAFAGQAAVDTASTRHFRQDEIEHLHVANAQLRILWAGTPLWVRFPPPVLDS